MLQVKMQGRRCAPEASGISAICPYLGGTMGESKARQRPGPWERARPRVHQRAPPRAELKKMRPQAGGIFDMSGARRTRRHPRAGALPGTFGFLIGELSTPVRQTAFPSPPLPARQRRTCFPISVHQCHQWFKNFLILRGHTTRHRNSFRVPLQNRHGEGPAGAITGEERPRHTPRSNDSDTWVVV